MNTKDDILTNVGHQTVDGSHLSYNGSQLLQPTVWWPTFFKISSSVFNSIKKLIQVLNKVS